MSGQGKLVSVALAATLSWSAGTAFAENVDPANDDSQYAYGENVGWLNAEAGGDGGSGVEVGDLALTGWMWGENIGWVSLSCVNTETCATTSYGVGNDGCGNLSGYAWAENVGWINFAPATGGVVISPQTGDFGGAAWGENIGWITFADDAPVAYGVTTGWRRHAPIGGPQITLGKDTTDLTISWDPVDDADGYDVFFGALLDLIDSGGDFGGLTGCLAEDQPETTHERSLASSPDDEYYLVRAVNCGGNGTCDSGGTGQADGRDGEVDTSGTCE